MSLSEKKYLKYKHKYLNLKKSLYNNLKQTGGNINDFLNRNIRIFNASTNSYIDLDSTTPNIMMSNKRPGDSQVLRLQHVRENLYRITNITNTHCITSNGNNREDSFSLQVCDPGSTNQIFRIEEINDIYYIHNTSNEYCMDANWGNNRKLLSWNCDVTNDNQKFIITLNFKHNDDDHNHIIPELQNLILAFDATTSDLEEHVMNSFNLEQDKAISISYQIVYRINPGFEKYGHTQSAIWCPLIYRALQLAGVPVPESWTIFHAKTREDQEIFQDSAIRLSEIDGWARYALYILTELKYRPTPEKKLPPDSTHERIFKLMISIRYLLNNH
jgi:hypothetical protein